LTTTTTTTTHNDEVIMTNEITTQRTMLECRVTSHTMSYILHYGTWSRESPPCWRWIRCRYRQCLDIGIIRLKKNLPSESLTIKKRPTKSSKSHHEDAPSIFWSIQIHIGGFIHDVHTACVCVWHALTQQL
jgi:hypothetical protein